MSGRSAARATRLGVLVLLAILAWPMPVRADDGQEVDTPGAALARLETEFKAALARHDEETYAAQRRILGAIADLRTPGAQLALRDLLVKHGGVGDRLRTLNILRALARHGQAEDLDEIVRYVERAHDVLLIESLSVVLAESKRESAQRHLRERALKRATPTIRAQILTAVGIIGGADATAAVLPYLKSEHLRERLETIHSLGMIADPAALGLLSPFADSKAEEDWRIRRAVVRTIGMIGQKASGNVTKRALRTLLRALDRESNPRVAEMTAQSLGMLGLPGAVPALIAGLEASVDSNLRLADAYGSALHRISGKPLGIDVQLWKSWWEVMKDQPFERLEQEGGGGTAAGVRYYGFPVRSSRVLFVLDISRSMGWNERLITARDELVRTIKKLPRSTKFNVLVYSDDVRAWRGKLAEARPANVRAAASYVTKQRPDNGTNSFAALKAAFQDESVDTIFFLTDGHPTTGTLIDPDLILASVKTWNRYRHVRLHTIALMRGDPPPAYAGREDPKSASAFMKRLAEQNSGRFREIR